MRKPHRLPAKRADKAVAKRKSVNYLLGNRPRISPVALVASTGENFWSGAIGGIALGAVLGSVGSLPVAVVGSVIGGLVGGAAGVGAAHLASERKRDEP